MIKNGTKMKKIGVKKSINNLFSNDKDKKP